MVYMERDDDDLLTDCAWYRWRNGDDLLIYGLHGERDGDDLLTDCAWFT